jgi:apolipoprotein N-acyltransferase
MPNVTIVFGVLLSAVSVFGYVRSLAASPSPTVFIPMAFGIVLIVLGILARKPELRKNAMHAAATVGLIGFLVAGGRGFMKLGEAASDDPTIHRAPRLVLLMALVCLTFVVTCVVSFIQARRRRAQTPDAT